MYEYTCVLGRTGGNFALGFLQPCTTNNVSLVCDNQHSSQGIKHKQLTYQSTNQSVNGSKKRTTATFKNKNRTHKRLKRMLFIMMKHSMRMFRVSPFFRLQNNT